MKNNIELYNVAHGEGETDKYKITIEVEQKHPFFQLSDELPFTPRESGYFDNMVEELSAFNLDTLKDSEFTSVLYNSNKQFFCQCDQRTVIFGIKYITQALYNIFLDNILSDHHTFDYRRLNNLIDSLNEFCYNMIFQDGYYREKYVTKRGYSLDPHNTLQKVYEPVSEIDDRQLVSSLLSEPAKYEQLAEEASELAQAALKVARIIRNENPTPVTIEQAKSHLVEEYTDALLAAETLDIRKDEKIAKEKISRWVKRLSKIGESDE